MDAEIQTIEARRRAMKIPTSSLCVAAGMDRRSYDRIVVGERRPLPSTVARLNAALNRFRVGFGAEAGQIAPAAAYKACLVLAAFLLETEPRAVLASDPGKRATLIASWRAAARVRRLGYYIANQFLGFRQADLARAAGVTKQAISSALRELYDERDGDAELARVLTRLEEIFE